MIYKGIHASFIPYTNPMSSTKETFMEAPIDGFENQTLTLRSRFSNL